MRNKIFQKYKYFIYIFLVYLFLSLTIIFFTPTGNFHVSGGKIIDPDGNVYIAKGINISDEALSEGDALASKLTAFFPGINFIRWPAYSYQPASYYQNLVDQLTSQKIVVEIENHPWPIPDAYSGSKLTEESNWYASLASAYKDNPYVWFGTMNEPQGGDITGQEVATYNAIRGAGNNNIIMMEAGYGIGNPGPAGIGSLTASDYTSMTNIAWDMHSYGWMYDSTDQTVVNNELLGSESSLTGILATKTITSADGVIPVLIGEFGISSTDNSNDPAGEQNIVAVTTFAIENGTSGFAAWSWDDGGNFNVLVQNDQLTSYGQQIANAIKTRMALR
jgi:hypothetical protein